MKLLEDPLDPWNLESLGSMKTWEPFSPLNLNQVRKEKMVHSYKQEAFGAQVAEIVCEVPVPRRRACS